MQPLIKLARVNLDSNTLKCKKKINPVRPHVTFTAMKPGSLDFSCHLIKEATKDAGCWSQDIAFTSKFCPCRALLCAREDFHKNKKSGET